MKTLFESITFNEVSYDVALLHQALAALGTPVAKKEVVANKAGPDTRAKAQALQRKLGVTAARSGVVDDALATAIATALAKEGLATPERSFVVRGNVQLADGTVKRRQRLVAFDLDLRAVATYRKVKTGAEMLKSGGFEPLGRAVSDHLGNYEIIFYDWQYQRAERKKADVVVFAVTEDGDARILGRSRLIDSEDYSNKGLVDGLEVTVTETDSRTEYEIVMIALQAFLEESEVSLREIADSKAQMTFAAKELDIELARVNIAADAERLATHKQKRLSHELLYGIGRQEIALHWAVLHHKTQEELRAAIAGSVAERIIRPFTEREIAVFLQALLGVAVQEVLDWKRPGRLTLNEFLSTALPEEPQRRAFVTALGNFSGSDFRDFWRKHLPAQPEFKDRPELISRLLLTQQLSLLTGHHPALITELHSDPCRKINSADELLALEPSDWNTIISRTGAPDFIRGRDEAEKRANYGDFVQGVLNAAFPTQRIARMIEKNQLPIERTGVSRAVANFLSHTPQFDFAQSRIHDFEREIRELAGSDSGNVRNELMRIQRVFQVSPSPEAMAVLMEHKLDSAYSIAHIPQKTFVRNYGGAIGGEDTAFEIHQRASYIATRAEMSAMHLMEYSSGIVPDLVMGDAEYETAMLTLTNRMPNYSELFGSPDLCECEHCRSVYGAAAYFVDLLRFLWRGDLNADGKSPLQMLEARRPDLLHLPLTCENTNTIIPYIDLANEVMEYYAVYDSLTNFEGYDTGETTAEELRANPQNFNLAAYRDRLNAAKYSFTLPYHQPLDVIRTYSDHLKVSRYDAMRAVNPLPNATTARAIASEALRLSPEEFRILTGAAFDAIPDAAVLHEYFGYAAAGSLEDLSAVPEFLRRSGVAYTDLVELVKTQFINPYQGAVDFLEKIFSSATIGPDVIYTWLGLIESGALNPAADADIMAAINAYNAAHGTGITAGAFAQWVIDHLGEFRQVITLYEPQSKCDLATTKLRTIQSIYEGLATSGISNNIWSRIHRFIRLWRKLGWSIHELDLVLAALGETDITAQTIASLESVSQLRSATGLTLDRLALLWGSIDTYGKKSLYRKLFLNKAVQRINPAFQADAWGNYLQSNAVILGDHQSAILAAFRIRDEDLAAIVSVARVIDFGNPRALDLAADVLNLGHLSTIYRYVVLAKALKMRVADFCQLTGLFGPLPFSVWDVQQKKFINVIPANTWQFHQLAEAAKKARFKAPVLDYILRGTVPPDSNLGLNRTKALLTVKSIREAFSVIDQDHPDVPPSPLTPEIVTAKLVLTFQPDVVKRFLDIVQGTAPFETVTDHNLNIAIPEALAAKYGYVKASGRLTGAGVMTDAERATLKGLTANVHFKEAVDALYEAPEDFIGANFNGILTDLVGAEAVLLDHPAQVTKATLDVKLEYVYTRFIPILKSKLRRDAITQHVAALVGLSDDAAALLLAADVSALIADVSTEGFSATYFSDATWTALALQRTDATVNFNWGAAAPAPLVPADNFSARWETYLAAPASGDYTLVVEVEEDDEAFRLYLDDALILGKIGADVGTTWEVSVTLNAAQMHFLRLEYAEAAQNSGVRLHWKTATTALEVIPALAVYPAAIIDRFLVQAALYHRAAKFISGFQITATELKHFLQFSADFGNIDFKALIAAHWKRMADYTALRNAVPQAQALLTDVFAQANTPDPIPTVADLKALLRAATAWDEGSIAFLVDAHFALGVNDFKNEIALNRLRAVMDISARTGISAETIAEWGAPETNFNLLHDTAQLIKNTVKANYEEEDWLELAGDLSDTIREHQKQALIAYLLTRPAIQAWGAVDADSLFEYFLIDVQMCACMNTSRIVQANAAVQMFVNRCLLNLESETSTGAEKGVSPTAIDQDRWQWMQNYRVWEANRKVFLYPENWLEPEWRNDRSEFFKDLESYLVQNDITDRSVEQAFRNFLTSLGLLRKNGQ